MNPRLMKWSPIGFNALNYLIPGVFSKGSVFDTNGFSNGDKHKLSGFSQNHVLGITGNPEFLCVCLFVCLFLSYLLKQLQFEPALVSILSLYTVWECL